MNAAGVCDVRSSEGEQQVGLVPDLTVDRPDAPSTEIGTVYGPPPTRIGGAGGEMITCACPMPGETVD